jgi:hypothetical protein
VRSDNGQDGERRPESQSATSVSAKAERRRKRKFLAELPAREAELSAELEVLERSITEHRLAGDLSVDLELEAVYLESEIEKAQAELEQFQKRLAGNKEKQNQLKNARTSNTMGREVSRDAE